MTGKTRPLLTLNLDSKDIEDLMNILKEHRDNTSCVDVHRLYSLHALLETQLYEARLNEFAQHIEDSLPNNDATDEEMDKFYNTPWTIHFNGKSICIENNAGIYNAMLDAIKEQIKDYI